MGGSRGTPRVSARGGKRGSSLRRRLRLQRIDYSLCHVFAPALIVINRLNGINRPPRDAPPACHQRQQGEGKAFYHSALALAEKVNIAGTPEREDDYGNAILEQHELCPALDLKIQFTMLHAFDTANLGSHGLVDSIATRGE